VTLGGGESVRLVIVFRAAPCEALQDVPAPDTFSTFEAVTLRFRVLGLLPGSQTVRTGRLFSVPIPSQEDC